MVFYWQSPDNSPIRCNLLAALPERRLIGVNSSQGKENIPLVVRWERAWVGRGVKWSRRRNGNGTKPPEPAGCQ